MDSTKDSTGHNTRTVITRNRATRSTAGLALLVGYALTQGLRDVYLSSAFGSIGFFDLVFLAFTAATMVFCGLLLIVRRSDFARLKRHWRGVVAVNITTTIAWLCYFGALRLIEPSVVATVFAGVSPMAVFVLAGLGLKAADGARAAPAERLAHAGIGATLVFLAWVVLSGRSGFAGISFSHGMLGLALAATSGLAITAETVYAKQMNEAGISAVGVLAFRFVLIAFVGAGAVFGAGQSSMAAMAPSALGLVTFNIVVLMVVPLLLVGKGLAMTSPLTTGIVAAFGPTVVFVMQAAEGRIPSSYWVLAATLAYVGLTGLSLLLRTLTSLNRG